ncbi:MAG TPA: DUF4340 domain-containing protein [Polyangiaceae bacterium]|jgi:hypothetical protein|nr:DUF4340 domain-containing protein [Polyangiaceae bacterium]
MNALRRAQAVNAVLIGVALALVVLVFATRSRVTTSEEEARSNNLLETYREEDITRIRFERKDGSFTLTRTKLDDAGLATWSVTAPVKEDAEPFTVQKLEGTLEFASALRRIKPEEVNRAAFGLDDPVLTIHVDLADIKYRLRIGAEAASPQGARYLEVAGENAPGKSIVLISKGLFGELNLKDDAFRERYVMPYLSALVDRLTIDGEGGLRKLRHATWQDGFRFDGMLGDARVNRGALDRMLAQFAHTRADRFIDPVEAEKAMAGATTVTVTMVPTAKASPTGVVIVGGACPGNDQEVVALRKEPDRVAACVPKTVLSGLTIPADALVDRTLFWIRPDEVEGFDLEQGATRLSLDRKESGFVMRAPQEGAVDAEAGNGRLESILRATGVIVEVPDKKAVGLDPPHGKVVMRSVAAQDAKATEETVALSAPTADGRIYAERAQDGVVLELGREAARGLVADASLVRSRTVLDLPITDVARVEIDGTPSQILDRAESGVLTLVAPKGFLVDGALGLELCDGVRNITADRWVADRDDGTFGLEHPSLRAKLSVRTKDGKLDEHVLVLGRQTASGFFATMEGDPGVFVLPRRLHETLTTLVLDRSALMMDPAITAKVTVLAKDRGAVFERRGDEFVQTDSGEPLSNEAIRKIIDTLSSLSAEAAVDVGPARKEQGFDRPELTVKIEREPGHPEKPPSTTFSVGAGDSWRGISVHYARVEGVQATYAVARSAVRALVDAL